MVCGVGAVLDTKKDDVTDGADAQSVPDPSVPPGCVARIVHVPVPVIVTFVPLTVHTSGVVEAYLTARLDVAVACPAIENGVLVPPLT